MYFSISKKSCICNLLMSGPFLSHFLLESGLWKQTPTSTLKVPVTSQLVVERNYDNELSRIKIQIHEDPKSFIGGLEFLIPDDCWSMCVFLLVFVGADRR